MTGPSSSSAPTEDRVVVSDQHGGYAPFLVQALALKTSGNPHTLILAAAAGIERWLGGAEDAEKGRRKPPALIDLHAGEPEPGPFPGRWYQDPLASRLLPVARAAWGALLVHAEHQGPLQRIALDVDEIGELGLEAGVCAELEGLNPVGLQAVFLSNPGGRDRPCGQSAGAPMGRSSRRCKVAAKTDLPRPPRVGMALEPSEPFGAVSSRRVRQARTRSPSALASETRACSPHSRGRVGLGRASPAPDDWPASHGTRLPHTAYPGDGPRCCRSRDRRLVVLCYARWWR